MKFSICHTTIVWRTRRLAGTFDVVNSMVCSVCGILYNFIAKRLATFLYAIGLMRLLQNFKFRDELEFTECMHKSYYVSRSDSMFHKHLVVLQFLNTNLLNTLCT